MDTTSAADTGDTTGTDRDVRALVSAWAAAEQANDPVAVAAFLADDFVGVGPVGFVLGREPWLRRFGHGLENRTLTVQDAQVHQHGTAAVVVGVQAQETTFGGADNSGRFRITLVAVSSEDGWRIASVHIGPLQGGPSSRPGA